MLTGTIKNAVKLQFLDNKWQQKKNNINAQRPKEMTQEERMLADFQEQAEKERENNKHADLYNKLKTGGRLTSEEVSYLEANDPEALRRYREDQAEKEAYEREIKNCRTKDEVERVKMNKLGNFASQAKQITNDPYIPLDKKVELMNQLNDKLCRVNEAHMDFLASKQYQDMPTEAELSDERTEKILDDVKEVPNDNGEDIEKEESALDDDTKIDYSKEVKDSDEDEFQKLSDSILRFVVATGERENKIDISL